MTTYKGACFCGAVQIEVSGEPKAWATVIADRAVLGRAARSTPLPSGSLTPYGSRLVGSI